MSGRLLAISVTAAVLMTACTGSGTTPAASPAGSPAEPAPQSEAEPHSGTVNATEKDFSITLASSSVPTGEIGFRITNEGPSTHEFVVLKTNLAPDALPVQDGAVDETEKGITTEGEVEDIAPGGSKDLALRLDPGAYVVICNIPGHYEAGMYAGLTVT